jgi:arylsulfatase A-like enzyme
MPGGVIREGNYKLIEYFETDELELYNLKEDLGEKHNLASELPGLAIAMREKLEAWRTNNQAQMPTPNPDYDPGLKSKN